MIPAGLEILSIPVFIIGVVFLWKGSDILVDGTSKAAAQIGVSALIISVILVGFGTSAPEFAISVGAAVQKNSDISLGNIIGSCIANLFLVLGVAAIIRPLKIQKGVIKREAPIMLAATIVLFLFSFFDLLDKYHMIGGIIFIFLFCLFVFFFIRCAKKERYNFDKLEKGKNFINLVFIFLGITGVIVGAYLLIESAVVIAEFFSVPQFVIAISLVAIGTSLPELVVSVTASFRDESDIAVGNVLGSNVFNILLILGSAALFIPLNAMLSVDHLLILLVFTVLIFPIIYTGHKISKIEGFFMVIIYFTYIIYSFVL